MKKGKVFSIRRGSTNSVDGIEGYDITINKGVAMLDYSWNRGTTGFTLEQDETKKFRLVEVKKCATKGVKIFEVKRGVYHGDENGVCEYEVRIGKNEDVCYLGFKRVTGFSFKDGETKRFRLMGAK